MSAQNEITDDANNPRLYREQIITNYDLAEFKISLLSDFKVLLDALPLYETDKLLKSQAVCEMLDISPSTLQNLRINGTLPFSRIGGSLYYSYREIMQVYKKNKVQNR